MKVNDLSKLKDYGFENCRGTYSLEKECSIGKIQFIVNPYGCNEPEGTMVINYLYEGNDELGFIDDGIKDFNVLFKMYDDGVLAYEEAEQDFNFIRVPKKIKLSNLLLRLNSLTNTKLSVYKNSDYTYITDDVAKEVYLKYSSVAPIHNVLYVTNLVPQDIQLYAFGTEIEVDL